MAIVEGTYTTSSAASYNYTVPSGLARYGVLWVQEEYGTQPTIAPTINGVALIPVNTTPIPAGAGDALWAFYLLESSMPVAGVQTVALNVSGGSGVQGRMSTIVVHTGGNQAAPTITSTASQTNVSTISIGSFSVNAGSLAMAAIMTGSGGVTSTESPGWTEKWDQSDAGADTAGAGASKSYLGATTDTVVFTASTIYGTGAGMVLVIDSAIGPPSITGIASITGAVSITL